MDLLHLKGVDFIRYLQDKCQDCDDWMQFITALGDPGRVMLLYFPLAYFCMPSVGVKLVWVAAISEWANAVLKWLLHGERPYWWVHETSLYQVAPTIHQYSLTCETGPGSPSGHAMVTSAVWFVLLNAFITHRIKAANPFSISVVSVWILYAGFLAAVCVSRCYIAAHFPHQIIAGTITGVLLGMACDRLPTSDFTLRHYISASTFLLLSGLATYGCLVILGYDPLWSVALAMKWCKEKDWIHLNTTLFAALITDAGSLLGFGMALYSTNYLNSSDTTEYNRHFQVLSVLLSWGLTLGSTFIVLPQQPVLLFYMLLLVQRTLMPYLVVAHVPSLTCLILSGVGLNGKYKNR